MPNYEIRDDTLHLTFPADNGQSLTTVEKPVELFISETTTILENTDASVAITIDESPLAITFSRTGPMGSKGLTGDTGSTGAAITSYILQSNGNIQFVNSEGADVGDPIDLTGPTGDVSTTPGPQGSTGSSVSTYTGSATSVQFKNSNGENVGEPIDLKGAKGDTGLSGTDGSDGSDGSDGTDGIDGIDGAKGLDGSAWFAGDGSPTFSEGGPSDFYLETDRLVVWENQAGTWIEITEIKGLKGDTGQTGDDGLNGDKGDDGAKGDDGLIGPMGLTGSTTVWRSGNITPSLAVANPNPNDFYFETDSRIFWEFLAGASQQPGGEWVEVARLDEASPSSEPIPSSWGDYSGGLADKTAIVKVGDTKVIPYNKQVDDSYSYYREVVKNSTTYTDKFYQTYDDGVLGILLTTRGNL